MRCITFFGNKSQAFVPDDMRKNILQNPSLMMHNPFEGIANTMLLRDIVMLRQVHGIDGVIVTDEAYAQSLHTLHTQGDFLVTSLPRLGLSVATADCLPVLLYDKRNQVVSAIHAGWQGALKGVVPRAIAVLQKQFGTRLEDLQVFFGPSAHACCYQVQEEFLHRLDDFDCQMKVLSKRNDSYYFDLPLFVGLQLNSLGIATCDIDTTANVCTICSDKFCSYRRDPKNELRQISLIALVPNH